MPKKQILWPAIVHYSGDNELIYIADQNEWQNDADLHVFSYEASDRLIDSQGMTYSLCQLENNFVTPLPTGQRITLEDVIEVVKAHLSELGSCCASKMSAPSIARAIALAVPDDKH